MYTPRINWFLFVLYLLGAIGILTASLLVPSFRSIAYAPLRELILPPPAPVVVSVLYSTEKEAWLNEAITGFEKTTPTVDGHPVKIELEKSYSVYSLVLRLGNCLQVTAAKRCFQRSKLLREGR